MTIASDTGVTDAAPAARAAHLQEEAMSLNHSTLSTAVRHALRAAFFTMLFCPPAMSQTLPPQVYTADLSGPRFGLTYLAPGVIDKLAQHDIQVGPNISQFGWQFEKQFYAKDSGVTMVTEWVALVGGLDQGVALPSLNWLVGLRTREGAEFGIGPNITPMGTGLVLAGGVTLRAGAMNVPLNVAVVPSSAGARVSFLAGFSLRR
jgi:hypothetical protein